MFHTFGREPVRREVDQIINEDNPQCVLKVGQSFYHNLYNYRIRITKIEAFAERPNFNTIYGSSFVSVSVYFPEDENGNNIELGNYNVNVTKLDKMGWILIKNTKEGSN